MQRREVLTIDGAAAVAIGDTVVSVWRKPLTPEVVRTKVRAFLP